MTAALMLVFAAAWLTIGWAAAHVEAETDAIRATLDRDD